MSDKIKIRNLEVFAHHGVYQEETKLGQKFLVDACLHLDLRRAGFSDEIQNSVDYGAVCCFITKYMKEHTFKLLEAVAEQLAAALLLEIPRIARVDVEIKKPWAPIGLPVEDVSVSVSRRWHTAYLGVGSNLGDRVGFVKFALSRLDAVPYIKDVRVSSLVETEPYGVREQPPFVNGAVALQTLYTPGELLDLLHGIEAEAGRERRVHWGPRTLDLDILFYDDCITEQKELIIPHPDMSNRMFVLEPLSELCPGKVHPVLGKTVLQMKGELEKV